MVEKLGLMKFSYKTGYIYVNSYVFQDMYAKDFP